MKVHQPILRKGSTCTDERKIDIGPCRMDSPQYTSKIRLNHYSTKSRDYFRCKALTPHPKRAGQPYRYGGANTLDALRRADKRYDKEVAYVLENAVTDTSMMAHRSCVVSTMRRLGTTICPRTLCWCGKCKIEQSASPSRKTHNRKRRNRKRRGKS